MTFPRQSKAKTNVKDLSYINLKTAVEEGGRSFICDFVQGKRLLSGAYLVQVCEDVSGKLILSLDQS